MTTSTNLVDYIGQGTLAARPASPSLNPDTFGLYWSTDVSQLSLWDGAWNENVLTGGGSSASTLSGVVTGGVAVWESALVFRVSAATYYINGVLYSSAEQTITLNAAHATLDRIDVIALDTSGNVVKVTGTAAATPSEPDIDQATQLKLTFVLVGATATAPAGITTENVYLENTEWTSSTSGSGFTVASTNNPYAGTKDIEGTAVASGAYVQLQRASPETLDSFSSLNLFIRSKAAWTSGRVLRLQFYSSGVAKGQAVTLATGFWGFDSSITSGYQFVAIPISQFVLPAGTSINQLRITDSGGSIGFYIDNITLTSTAATVGGSGASGITQAQADARYQPLDSDLTAIAALATTSFGRSLLTLANNAAIKPTESLIIACSDETSAITTGTAKVTYRMPYAFTLTDVRASVNTAPTGSTILIDINEGGTTILSTKLMIDASEKTSTTAATPAVISDASLADDAEITIDFDQVGSTIAGKGVKVALIGTRT